MVKYEFRKDEHLHLLNGQPLTGTSSVVGVLNKPLTWWAVGKGLEKLGWINSKKKVGGKYVSVPKGERLSVLLPRYNDILNLSLEKFLELLDEAYYAHSKAKDDAAEKGTDLHAELEKFVKSEMGKKKYDDKDFPDQIQPFIKWSRENVREYIASEAHTFSEKMWVGGITDAVAKMKDGKLAIIDFKSSKETYTSQFIQAAGYSIQIDETGLHSSDGEQSLILGRKIEKLIIVPFGAEELNPEVREFLMVEKLKEAFKSALNLYRILKTDEEIKN